MEIPERYKGDIIVSFFQIKGVGIGMISYRVGQSQLYERDKAEMEGEGEIIFAEFRGVNSEFERMAGMSLARIDRTRGYQKGEVGIEFVLKN